MRSLFCFATVGFVVFAARGPAQEPEKTQAQGEITKAVYLIGASTARAALRPWKGRSRRPKGFGRSSWPPTARARRSSSMSRSSRRKRSLLECPKPLT